MIAVTLRRPSTARHFQLRQGGFTLIEIVMVIVILGVLAGLTAPIFSQGLTASRFTQLNLQTLAKLRYATERLAREIRQIDSDGTAYQVTTMVASNLVFAKAAGSANTVSVSLSGSQLMLGYSSPASVAVLTDEVSVLNFAYYDIDGASTVDSTDLAFVEIFLSLQNPVTGAGYSQRTRVALRDKT